jgi:RHS repeat-associated protein
VTSRAANLLFFDNGRGDITELADPIIGAVVAHVECSPFGKLLVSSGPLANANTYRFSSKEHDVTGLAYYGHRYYSPELGRWINRDPIGEKGGPNPHRFADNAALNGIDPTGLLFFWMNVDNKIATFSGFPSQVVDRPASSQCPAKKNVGQVRIRYAYIDADDSQYLAAYCAGSSDEQVAPVYEAIIAAVPSTIRSRASIKTAGYLGAGFIIDFTKSKSVDDVCCCDDHLIWYQEKQEWGGGAWSYDVSYEQDTFADFGGTLLGGWFGNKGDGRRFRLQLRCGKTPLLTIKWWWHAAIYSSGTIRTTLEISD